MKNEFTILSEDDYKKLLESHPTYRDYILECNPTDFAQLCASSSGVNENKQKRITSTRDVNEDGEICLKTLSSLDPRIPIKNIKGVVIKPVMINISTYRIPEYPESILTEKKEEAALNKAFIKQTLVPTGKKYTIGDKEYFEYYKPLTFDERLVDKKGINGHKKKVLKKIISENNSFDEKVIRYVPDRDVTITLRNGKRKKFEAGVPIWIEVKKIYWDFIRDDMALPRHELFSGIPFTNDNSYYGNIKKTNMYEFLNKTFAKEILRLEYYLIEEVMEKINSTEKVREICYKLVDEKYPEKNILTSIDEIVEEVRNNYPNLTNDEYRDIALIIVTICAAIMKKPSFQEKMSENKGYAAFNPEKIQEKKENIQNEIVEELLKKNISADEATEYIYITRPYITNDELIEILQKYSDRLSNVEEDSNTPTKK